MEEFDYGAAMAELEVIVKKVEDPSTSIHDIEKYITRSDELVRLSRQYLRELKTKTDNL